MILVLVVVLLCSCCALVELLLRYFFDDFVELLIKRKRADLNVELILHHVSDLHIVGFK